MSIVNTLQEVGFPTISFICGALILTIAIIRKIEIPQAKIELSKAQSIALGVLGGLFILFSIFGFVSPMFPNYSNFSGCSLIAEKEIPAPIMIYEKSYHLGDDVRSDLDPENPQSNPFEASFQIERASAEIVLRLTVKDLNTEETKAPVKVYINGIFIDYLNRYVPEEKPEPTEVEIPILIDTLQRGENNLLIFSVPYIYGDEKGVDDFDISNVGIIFK